MAKHRTTNSHHLCARSMGWTNNPDNLLDMPINKHTALHQLFANKLPADQLKKVIWINRTCLTEEFKNDILKILSESDNDYYYKQWVLVKKPRVKQLSLDM